MVRPHLQRHHKSHMYDTMKIELSLWQLSEFLDRPSSVFDVIDWNISDKTLYAINDVIDRYLLHGRLTDPAPRVSG